MGDILLGVNGHNVNKLDAEKVKDSIIRNTNTVMLNLLSIQIEQITSANDSYYLFKVTMMIRGDPSAVYVVQLEILPGMYSRSGAMGVGHLYRSSMPSPNFSTLTNR